MSYEKRNKITPKIIIEDWNNFKNNKLEGFTFVLNDKDVLLKIIKNNDLGDCTFMVGGMSSKDLSDYVKNNGALPHLKNNASFKDGDRTSVL